MEGSKGRLRRSLGFRLTLLLMILGLVGAIAASTWSYRSMLREAESFVDEELSQIAAIVINYDMLIPRRWEGPRRMHERVFARLHTRQGDVIIASDPQGLGRGAQSEAGIPTLDDLTVKSFDIVIAPLIGRPGDNLYLPITVKDGFYTVLISDKRVRVFVATKVSGQRFVVARPLSSAMELSARAFNTSLMQFLMLMGLYVPSVILLIRFMFRPLNQAAAKLMLRDPEDLSPVAVKKAPSEIDSFLAALSRLLDKVRESVELKRRFIADAAHEMRTPLTALSLQAENLLALPLSVEAREAALDLQKGIQRERELMTALLDLARAQDSAGGPELSQVSVRELFIEIMEELGDLVDRKGQDLGLEGECAVRIVTGYRPLKAVLVNLISNAVKYTPEGGQIDLKAVYEGERAVLSVSDTGPGIDEELLPRVMEPFFRVHGDTEKAEGSGLGLAIAAAQVHRLKGTLFLKNRLSADGKRLGLEARLTLPLSLEEKPAPAAK